MNKIEALSSTELAAMLCSRVCHDIAGPTNSMGAALSVLDDGAADMRDEAIALLKTGAAQIRAKIEYARVCFGAAGSRSSEVALSEIKSMATGMFGQSRSELVFRNEVGAIDRNAARVLLNLIWLAVDSLPRGGSVTIEAAPSADGGARLRLVAAGPRLRLDASYILAFRGETPEAGFDSRNIQPYYTGLIARESGGRADASQTEERVEFAALIGPGRRADAAE